jgi:hypothetical protein
MHPNQNAIFDPTHARGRLMKSMMFLPVVLLLALSGVPALAKNDGPILGAGLPILLVGGLVGGGIYWIVRRRKRASED